MFGRFLPRETSFFDFFEQHAGLTIEGTKEFLSMVTTGANIPAKCRRISDIEHETDTITHRCVEALHKTFITPIDRDSIHRLITRMDDIMDFVEAAAERIELYEIGSMTLATSGFRIRNGCGSVADACAARKISSTVSSDGGFARR